MIVLFSCSLDTTYQYFLNESKSFGVNSPISFYVPEINKDNFYQVGDLKEQLSLFWEKSRHKMGWNGAHNSFPHITLSSSFSCPNIQVEQLVHTIAKVISILLFELIIKVFT